MNMQTAKGNWNELKGKVREKWGQLTDDEITRTGGNIDQLVGLIQRKTGQARDQIESFFEDFTSEAANRGAHAMQMAGNLASNVAEAGREYAEHASEAIQAGYENTRRLVRQRPVESMGVVFGAGLVAGVVLALVLRGR